MISAPDLDAGYTHLCKTMTKIGARDAQLFLARFAVLAMAEELEPDSARRLIDAAAAHWPVAAPGAPAEDIAQKA